MNSVIRDMSFKDLPAVLRIERESFPSPWSAAMFVLEMTRVGSLTFVSENEEGELEGYVVCTKLDLDWHLMNIAVPVRLRRSGIAQSLMRELVDRVGPDSRITLEVRPSNIGAIALYEAWGFLAAGRRRGYYPDSGEDAIVMWRTERTLHGSLEGIPAAEEQPR